MSEYKEVYMNIESESEDEEWNIEAYSSGSDDEDAVLPKKKRKLSVSPILLHNEVSSKMSKNKTSTPKGIDSRITRASKLQLIKSSQNKTVKSATSKLKSIKTSQNKKSSPHIKRGRKCASSCPNKSSSLTSDKCIGSVPSTKIKNSISSVTKSKRQVKAKKIKSKTREKFKTQECGWKSANFTPKLFDFDVSTSGLSSHVPENSNYDPSFFFELFFDEKLIDMIVDQSNKYHHSIPVRCKDSNKRKHQKAWVDIERPETVQ